MTDNPNYAEMRKKYPRRNYFGNMSYGVVKKVKVGGFKIQLNAYRPDMQAKANAKYEVHVFSPLPEYECATTRFFFHRDAIAYYNQLVEMFTEAVNA